MELTQLGIDGAWLAQSQTFDDQRGSFQEWFKREEVKQNTGIDFAAMQANISLSCRGVVRGIHYSLAEQGQSKWITCVTGSIQDIIVDIRPDSRTFGKWAEVILSGNSGKSILIGAGLGHAFLSLEDNTTVAYLLSSPYSPGEEYEINPLDTQINITWDFDLCGLIFSEKDKYAPTLEQRLVQGNLPRIGNDIE